MTETIPTAEEAMAYAQGYAAALDDCDRADVADLINKLDAEKVRHSFTKALLQIAERKLADLAASAVAVHNEWSPR